MPKHEEAEAPRVCVDCGAVAPKTQTDYTLISAKHGWRLARIVDPQRGVILDWRCPECWERHKAARVAAGAPPSSTTRPTTSSRADAPPSTRVTPATKPSQPPSTPRPVSAPTKSGHPPSAPPPTLRSWAPPPKPRTPR